jgi:DNA-binding CsgD family transcriptional regulator/ribosomal protein S14
VVSRDDLIARARSRRAQRATLTEIAGELGVSTTTVARWVDPDQARRDRERSRQAKLARRVPCERCGRPLSYQRAGGVCRQCLIDDAHARIDQVADLYREGLDAPEIAREVELAEGYVAILLSRLARGGTIQLRRVSKDRSSTRERERQIISLRCEGLSRREIAGRVGLTPGALGVVLARLRARGSLSAA